MKPVFLIATLLACVSCTADRAPNLLNQSFILARLPDTAQDDIMDAVQKKIQTQPSWGAKIASHGRGAPEVYDVTFNGTCTGEAALVADLSAILREGGAKEVSCIAAARFAPGEPLEFRR